MFALQCHGLVKNFQDIVAVNGLDLEVRGGECFGLLGPNGAGKTTTTEMLEGLLTPDSGSIEVLGESWGGAGSRRLRERLGVALQETQLTDRLTVEETVRLFRSFYRDGRNVPEVIGMLGLEEKKRSWVSKLSGGQRQRLALACALVGSPEVLFLDEPTTGLDPQARHRVWEVVEDFQGSGGTVFLTTHYMEEAQRLCDRVGIMDRGKLIALDSPEVLIDSLQAEQIIEISTDCPLNLDALEQVEGVGGCSERDDVLVIRVAHLEKSLPLVLAEVGRQDATIQFLKTHQATLEDVFVHLTGRGLSDA